MAGYVAAAFGTSIDAPETVYALIDEHVTTNSTTRVTYAFRSTTVNFTTFGAENTAFSPGPPFTLNVFYDISMVSIDFTISRGTSQ